MGTLLQDLRYGFRMLARNRAVTALAVLALALGIGANTAIFSVVNGILLRPLPYKDPGRLVLIEERLPKLIPGPIPMPAPDVVDFQKNSRVFEQVAGFRAVRMDLSGIEEPQQLTGARVSACIFRLLGVQPFLGRAFTTEEDQPGSLVTVLSNRLWQRRFGGDPTIIGRKITLDRQPYTVVGVMPSGFHFPDRGLTHSGPVDLWVPMAFTPEELSSKADNFNFSAVARLKPDVSLARANEDANVVAKRIQQEYPADDQDLEMNAVVSPLQDKVVARVRTLLLVLLGAVGFVLLIACANVANLLLTRAAARQKEVSVRMALGAGRFRLIRQFLVESTLLATVGGSLGLLAALWGTDALVSLLPGNIPRVQDIHVDFRVMLFAAVLALFTGLIFGIAPALAATGKGVNETLKESGRSSTGSLHRHHLRSALVVSEVALALTLLVGSGLLIRSFLLLRNSDPGFDPEHTLTMSVALPDTSYSKPAQVRTFFHELLQKMNSIAGVEAAGACTNLPLQGGWTRTFVPEGYSPSSPGKVPMVSHTLVVGNYFQALGIALKRGRYFTDQDRPGTPSVVIVSEGLAERYWPGENPIGKRLKWGLTDSPEQWLTVVGVVADVNQGTPDAAKTPHTYQPYFQVNDDTIIHMGHSLHVALRAASEPSSLASAARDVVHSLDPDLPVADIETMDQILAGAMAPHRFAMLLMLVFAGAALVLAAIGIYGVMSYAVAQRTHEIGIRMALGASRSDVLKLVVRHGMALALAGVTIGLLASLALMRILGALLYGVGTSDPITFAGVSFLLAAVAFVASYVPARRATAVDPITALRYE